MAVREVARLLANNPTNTVILIGGILSQDGSSVTGLLSEQAIRELLGKLARLAELLDHPEVG